MLKTVRFAIFVPRVFVIVVGAKPVPQEPSQRRVRWPNYAKFYRDDAAKRSIDVIQELEPIVEGRVQDVEKIKARVNRAYVAAQKILLRLISADADVEPP